MGCDPLVNSRGKVMGFVCSPTARDTKKKFYKCKKCKKKRLHIIRFYEWYAPDGRCLTCKNYISFEE